jgi:hypothetical protein
MMNCAFPVAARIEIIWLMDAMDKTSGGLFSSS